MLLTVKQAAEFLGMSVKFVRLRVADGEIPSVKLGNRIRIRPADLEKYVADQAGASE